MNTTTKLMLGALLALAVTIEFVYTNTQQAFTFYREELHDDTMQLLRSGLIYAVTAVAFIAGRCQRVWDERLDYLHTANNYRNALGRQFTLDAV